MTRALRIERTTARGGAAEAGTTEHEKGRNIARFLYWTAVVGGFFVGGGIPGLLLFGASVPLKTLADRADAEADAVHVDGSTERGESLARVAGYAQIAQYAASALL